MQALSSKLTPFKSQVLNLSLCLLTAPCLSAQAPPRGPDFNHDWFDDVAIGTGQENWNSVADAGMVSVGYGSSNGLGVPAGHLGFLTQDTNGLADSVETGDVFGSALAWGDFDGDCFDDLAIGSFLEDLNGHNGAGAIHVVFGTASGLSGSGSQFLHRDVAGVADSAGDDDWFGSELAAGDFNGDGFDDLAVSVKADTVLGVDEAGSVHIFYGSAAGLSVSTDHIVSRATLGLEAEVYFGYALTAGDFDCDGRDDLAISTPFADPEAVPNGGDVVVLYGTVNGLSTIGFQLWYQGHNGLGGSNESADYFGTALAAGNFNGDTFRGRHCQDLAIGIDPEDVGTVVNAGAVHVIYGSSANGLQASSPNDQVWTQNTSGIVGSAGTEDRFGYALVVGRFNNDDYDDLAIGIPNENDQGAVALLRGAAAGLSSLGDVLWDQDTTGISGVSETGDKFGKALGYASKLSWNGSTLLIGVPYEDLNGLVTPGYVHACTLDSYAGSSLSLLDESGLVQTTFGGSSPEAFDRFGETLLAPRHVPFRCPM